MNQEEVGKLIKKIRLESGLTQEKFALKYNVTYQAVSKWETGKSLPDIAIIQKICDEYDYDLNEFFGGNSAKRDKRKIVSAILIVIVLALVIVFLGFKYFKKSENFNFKTLTTTCDNFKLFGSIAYNDLKTSIYISNITYCGKDNEKEYNNLECTLYEQSDNTKIKISNYIYDKNESITLEEFLKEIKFNIDNYAKTCKNFKENDLVLEIVAETKDKNKEYYEIPLKLEENCQN